MMTVGYESQETRASMLLDTCFDLTLSLADTLMQCRAKVGGRAYVRI